MKRVLFVKEKTAYHHGFSRGLALGLILLAAFIVLTDGLLYGQGGLDALFIDENGTVKVEALEVKGVTNIEGATTLNNNLTINGAVGIGVTEPKAQLHIHQEKREGIPADSEKLLYVTGDFIDGNGVEFRHTNESQGIGIGYNTIYATGYSRNQNLNLKPQKEGHVSVQGDLNVDGETTLGKSLTVKGDIKMSGDLELNGQLKPNFDSGWFQVARNKKYERKHNLGALPIRVQMFFSPNPNGSPQYIVGMMNSGFRNGYNVEMTAKKFIIITGSAHVCVYRASVGNLSGISPKTGWYRFLAWR